MNKSIYVKMLLCILLLGLFEGPIIAQTDPNMAQQAGTPGLGREDPFGSIVIKSPLKSVTEQTPLVSTDIAELKPELSVETVMLKFLKAENVKSAVENMSGEYGTIATDENTNSLIVCDTQEKLAKIIAAVRKADQTPRQILIEVVIADVKLTDDTEIGVNWNRFFNADTTHFAKQHLLNTFSTSTAATAGIDFGLIRNDLALTIHALQETQDVEIIASPRVLVLSGSSARIKTIEEIPYTETSSTSEGGTLTSTEFKEVGVTLEVSATVMDNEDRIMLTIKPKQSAKVGDSIVGDVPIVDTREAETTLLMEDGQVVLIGGLRKKETTISRDQVPLLGDLPLLGFLFSKDTKETKNTELLVFLSPHIDKGETLSDDQLEKFNELRNKPLLKMPEYDFLRRKKEQQK
ncbi:MAG: secretin N-terminal domain-containing protein [Planctomycetota bacterium]